MELTGQDSTQVLQTVDRLLKEYPESYYVPYGLNMKADLLLRRVESVEEARTIYRLLLEKYPNYPFTSEVRKKLRELETDVLIG